MNVLFIFGCLGGFVMCRINSKIMVFGVVLVEKVIDLVKEIKRYILENKW